MMYNRYVPDAAGVYRPTRVEDVPLPPPVQPPAPPPVPEAPPEPPAPCPPLPVRQDAGGLLSRLLPRSIDTGDLLMLLILLVLRNPLQSPVVVGKQLVVPVQPLFQLVQPVILPALRLPQFGHGFGNPYRSGADGSNRPAESQDPSKKLLNGK